MASKSSIWRDVSGFCKTLCIELKDFLLDVWLYGVLLAVLVWFVRYVILFLIEQMHQNLGF